MHWTGIDMTNRRQFLAGALATGLVPMQSWADAGSPRYLSAAKTETGDYVLCGIGGALDLVFQIALPARGHAAAAHPTKPIAVTFARRPGTFAIVINCVDGQRIAVLDAPSGRHFYGHGVFSQDGRWLFTTENNFAAGRGVIGVWDSHNHYTRVGEFGSGGIGPHDIKRIPNTDVLVVANGGIDTHPDSGRIKLNIPTMTPNLCYVENGAVIETRRLDGSLHKNSIRHLTVAADGLVAFGMQWQGQGTPDSLVGFHRRGQDIILAKSSPNHTGQLQNYVGSIAFGMDNRSVVATSPVGNVYHVFDVRTAAWIASHKLQDVCGVASGAAGVVLSNGAGQLMDGAIDVTYPYMSWDNHLIAI